MYMSEKGRLNFSHFSKWKLRKKERTLGICITTVYRCDVDLPPVYDERLLTGENWDNIGESVIYY